MKSVLLMGAMVYLVVLFGASVSKKIARILSLVEYKLKRLPCGCIVQLYCPSIVLVVLLQGHVRIVNYR